MTDSEQSSHEVDLCWADGRIETIRVDRGETIVEAAEATDVRVPYGCREGFCGTCTAELCAGDVTHLRRPRALTAKSLAAGYVLACIATPETDCRLRVGHEIQASVVGTPWK